MGRRLYGEGFKIERGFVQIYTGDGKGKTTAAFGLAMRAAGRKMKVMICQFMKGTVTGEVEAARRLAPWLEIRRYGDSNKFIWQQSEAEQAEFKKAITQGLEEARAIAREGLYDLLILDEILVAVDQGLIDQEQVCELIRQKSPHVELILTGRNAASEIIELADLVTEMREVKHYFKRGVPARAGIEY